MSILANTCCINKSFDTQSVCSPHHDNMNFYNDDKTMNGFHLNEFLNWPSYSQAHLMALVRTSKRSHIQPKHLIVTHDEDNKLTLY